MYYEVLWYEDYVDETGAKLQDCHFKSFKSKKSALHFYEQHKDDSSKYDWWVTKRDNDGTVLEDMII